LQGLEARKEQIMRVEKGRKVETSVEARAGFLDRHVLIVLCVSLALALVVLGTLWLGFFTPGA
jgi:TRAP-type mannitol/chloroaromatic compound transport system permease large subunit